MSECVTMRLAGAELIPDPSGALWWPDMATLIVADLHLEKGASFARHGTMLPPYDTRATLDRLAACIATHAPAHVVALGDSFHRADSADFLDDADARLLAALVKRQNWTWLAGNHDPAPPATRLGGTAIHGEMRLGPLTLRHEAAMGDQAELSGHYHPKARLRLHGRSVSYRCFVADAARIVLPAFGAYAGGLDVSAPALRRLFPQGFTAHLIGRAKVTAIPHRLLLPELMAF